MSSGLDYVPGCYAKTEELVELVKVVKEYGGFYFTHWRSIRRDEVTIRDKLAGIKEALEIGRRAGVKVELSHLTSGFTIFPRPSPELERASAEATLEVIDEAIKGGVDVYFDIIPNTTGGTLTFRYLASILAPWLRELGSREALSRALRMKDFRDEIKKAILEGKVLFLHPSVNPYWSEELEVVGHKEDKYKGKTIAEIAREEGKDPIDALFDILASDPNTIIYEKVERGEEEIKTFLRHERCMIGLDTYSFSLYWEMKGPPHYLPHPNTYGAVPRLIRKYVREEKVLSLEEAIRRLTSMPARRFMIDRRGVIEPGAYADIVIFDYNTISEVIDKEEPRRPPKGIHYVIVNGVLVVEKGRHTGAKPGKVIRFRRARGERP
ncbi:MAG: hypothetical protein DRM97_07505 [Thermoprotei archaeon]|nr:MAG: hypothetical protein DRM97_07505 [Thermoprotei archaeon]